MNPDKMRHCMSLGYSAKSKVKNTIGQCKLIVLNPVCYLLTTTQHNTEIQFAYSASLQMEMVLRQVR